MFKPVKGSYNPFDLLSLLKRKSSSTLTKQEGSVSPGILHHASQWTTGSPLWASVCSWVPCVWLCPGAGALPGPARVVGMAVRWRPVRTISQHNVSLTPLKAARHPLSANWGPLAPRNTILVTDPHTLYFVTTTLGGNWMLVWWISLSPPTHLFLAVVLSFSHHSILSSALSPIPIHLSLSPSLSLQILSPLSIFLLFLLLSPHPLFLSSSLFPLL